MVKIIKDLGSILPSNTRSANPRKRKHYLVECECGVQWEALAENVNAGKVTKCIICKGKAVAIRNHKHGGYTNGKPTRLMAIYKNMIARCTDPKDPSYPRYGGKGVTVAPEWLCKDTGFTSFKTWAESNSYADHLVIDKDILCDELGISPKVYSPITCKWITPQENGAYTSRLSESEQLTLVNLYTTGTNTPMELAEIYDYTYQGILYILEKYDVYKPTPNKRTKFPSEA